VQEVFIANGQRNEANSHRQGGEKRIHGVV